MKIVKTLDMRTFSSVMIGDYTRQEKLVFSLVVAYSYMFHFCNITICEMSDILRIGNTSCIASIHSLQEKGLITQKPYIATCVSQFRRE